MLFCAAPPMCREQQVQTRRAMPQLNLNFTDIPIPETHLWEQLDDQQKRIVIETLARLMTNATRTDQRQEQTNDCVPKNPTAPPPARRLRLHSPVHARTGRA